MVGLGNLLRPIGTEEKGDGLRINPDKHTGEDHGNGDEAKGLAQNESEGLLIALSHLNGT